MNLKDFIKKSDNKTGIAMVVFQVIQKHYKYCPISEIAKTTSGGTPNRSNYGYYGGNIPWLKSGELNDGLIINHSEDITEEGLNNSSAKLFPKGTLLLALYGATLGKVGILDFDSATNQAICAIFPIEQKVDKKYLFRFLKQHRLELIKKGFGGAQPNISQAVVNKTNVPLPPLDIQKDIVNYLENGESLKLLPDNIKNKINDNYKRFIGCFGEMDAFGNKLSDSSFLVKRLRQSILQNAIEGKLVSQDSEDEPASELLKKIKLEKENLIREKKIKKGKNFAPISDGEKSFELPKTWEWVRLGDISYQVTDGSHYTPTYVNEGIPFLSVKDVAHGTINFSKTRFISIEEHKEFTKRCYPEYGDILLTKVGTTGIAKIIDTKQEFSIFVSIALIKFFKNEIYGKYLEHLINSPYVKDLSEKGTEGVGNKNLVLRKIVDFILPIPPLAEQHRIVAKIDELMKFCDNLEKQITEAKENGERLMESVLGEVFK